MGRTQKRRQDITTTWAEHENVGNMQLHHRQDVTTTWAGYRYTVDKIQIHHIQDISTP